MSGYHSIRISHFTVGVGSSWFLPPLSVHWCLPQFIGRYGELIASNPPTLLLCRSYATFCRWCHCELTGIQGWAKNGAKFGELSLNFPWMAVQVAWPHWGRNVQAGAISFVPPCPPICCSPMQCVTPSSLQTHHNYSETRLLRSTMARFHISCLLWSFTHVLSGSCCRCHLMPNLLQTCPLWREKDGDTREVQF